MFVIDGGAPLNGTVRVGGSKNAVLPMMAAAILCDGPVHLVGVPRLVDVSTMSELLSDLGVGVEWTSHDSLLVNADTANCTMARYDVIRRMRASVCVLGPLLARFGAARVSLPGGCNIGLRPIDIHLRALQAMGADIRLEQGYVVATTDGLRAAEIDMCGPRGATVTGTCNLMMAASRAKGTTVLHNAAMEPEVVELGKMLVAAGCRIAGLGNTTIEIEGQDRLYLPEPIRVVPDRIEAATLAVAAAVTGGQLTISNAPISQMAAVVGALQEVGVHCETHTEGLIVSCRNGIRPAQLTASPYPGLPTDVQAQFMALLSLAEGESRITDTVFPDRFMHAAELVRMGAEISVEAGTAVVQGVPRLSGAAVMASDLRASAALVIAALAAEGRSEIRRVYHLDRGYAAFDKTLQSLGARVLRCPESSR